MTTLPINLKEASATQLETYDDNKPNSGFLVLPKNVVTARDGGYQYNVVLPEPGDQKLQESTFRKSVLRFCNGYIEFTSGKTLPPMAKTVLKKCQELKEIAKPDVEPKAFRFDIELKHPEQGTISVGDITFPALQHREVSMGDAQSSKLNNEPKTNDDDFSVSSGPSDQVLTQVFKKVSKVIHNRYGTQLKNGKIEIKINIKPNGHVKSFDTFEVTGDLNKFSILTNGIKEIINGYLFPTNSADYSVQLPLVFTASSK